MTLHSRIERVNEEIRMALSEILAQSKDPRLQDRMVTVSGVKTAPDLSFAKVWVSVYGNEEERKNAFEAINHAKSFLRTRLAHSVVLRVVPQLTFVEDTSFAYADKINTLLNQALPPKTETPDDEPSENPDSESDR